MKMPMTDTSSEKHGGAHIDKAVKEDATSGSKPAPETTADARKSGGPGVRGGRMSKAVSTLSKMKA